MSTQPTSRVKALGEIAFRVEDLDRMQSFYEEVVGLRLMRRYPNSAFFNIAEGFEGHTQILALFDRTGSAGYSGLDAVRTTVDHIAFSISLDDFETERQRLEGLGLEVTTTTHAWVQWRSLYVNDPEGNRVEFVCYDESIV
ncbi:MAG: VOC family protein [Ardenticatenaceae bacterium]